MAHTTTDCGTSSLLVLNVKNKGHLTIALEMAVLATQREGQGGGHHHHHEEEGDDHDHDHDHGSSPSLELKVAEIQDDRLEEYLKSETKAQFFI